jgi:ppGpp synthetase/RelA/SpoT-type nucleotidyltranferase
MKNFKYLSLYKLSVYLKRKINAIPKEKIKDNVSSKEFQRNFISEHNLEMYNIISSKVFQKTNRDEVSKLILLSRYHESFKGETIPREVMRELGSLYPYYNEVKSKDFEPDIDKDFYSDLFKTNLPLLIFRTIDLSKIPLRSDKDLLVNCFGFNPKNFEEERKNLARKMLDLYSPVSDIFGFKNVLESIKNTSVEVLHPENYLQVKNILFRKNERLEEIKKSFENILLNTINEFKEIIPFSVFEDGSRLKGRIKSPGSIVLKMIDKDLPTSKVLDLHDLVAFTVLVENQKDAIELWELLKSQFNTSLCEDYISSPRTRTGYQALHVDIFYDEIRVEVQIKTPEMYLRSEKGDWSHAIYKNKSMKDVFLKLQELFTTLENSSTLRSEAYLINIRGERISAHYSFNSENHNIRLDKDSNVFDLIMLSKISKNPFKVKVYSKNTGVEFPYTHIIREGSSYVLEISKEQKQFTKKDLYDLRACCFNGESHVYLSNLIKKTSKK